MSTVLRLGAPAALSSSSSSTTYSPERTSKPLTTCLRSTLRPSASTSSCAISAPSGSCSSRNWTPCGSAAPKTFTGTSMPAKDSAPFQIDLGTSQALPAGRRAYARARADRQQCDVVAGVARLRSHDGALDGVDDGLRRMAAHAGEHGDEARLPER